MSLLSNDRSLLTGILRWGIGVMLGIYVAGKNPS